MVENLSKKGWFRFLGFLGISAGGGTRHPEPVMLCRSVFVDTTPLLVALVDICKCRRK